MAEIFDLSHPIREGMTIFPGDPVPHLTPHPTAPPWRVTAVQLGTHTGTHMDAPAHFFPSGKTLDCYPPSRFLGTGVVLDFRGLADETAISAEHVRPLLGACRPGWFALLCTGWDAFWGTERFMRHPYLTGEAAAALVEAGISLVGIDALNVDATQAGTSAAHEQLLRADVLIVENLRGLTALRPGEPYRCAFFPLPLAGTDGAPVRAVAWQDER